MLGVGIKIPKVALQQYPNLITEWIEFYRASEIHYPLVGLDQDEKLMKNGDSPHYHIHFLTSRTEEQIKKRREKFKIKLGRSMILYTSKGILSTRADALEFLGYAIKDTLIDSFDGSQQKPTVELFGEELTLAEIRPYAECAKKKKHNIHCKEEKELKDKEIKKSKEDEILEYLAKHIIQLDAIEQIYERLIEYQIDNDVYLENFRMQKIAHKFIQKNRQSLGLTNFDIVRFRNLR